MNKNEIDSTLLYNIEYKGEAIRVWMRVHAVCVLLPRCSDLIPQFDFYTGRL